MKFKRKIALFLVVILILIPVFTSAEKVQDHRNEDVTILNDDIYNLVYT